MTLEGNEAFYKRLDAAILTGEACDRIAARFNIRERGVRRRKASLKSQGHRIPTVQGNMPRVKHVEQR